MIHRSSVLNLCISALMLAGCASPTLESLNEKATKTDSLAQQSQEVMEGLSADYPAMSATVIVQDRVVWSFAHGEEIIGGSTYTSTSTRFNTYSVAKAVTGLAFARLIERGEVHLDTSVAEIAPDLSEVFHEIRLQDLLSHTSGIRHYASPADWIAFAELHCGSPLNALEYFDADALVHKPGEAQTYSTFAFVLASELLIRLTGKPSFIDALNETLGPWSELELDHIGAEKAQPYIRASRLPKLPSNAAPEDLVQLPFETAECKFGGGGLIMSSKELANAGASLHNGRIIPLRELKDRLEPWSTVSGTVYGGGVLTRNIADQEITVFNVSGGAPGGRSVLITLIEPQISIAIAGNIEGPRLEDSAWKLAEAWVSARP